MEKAGQPLRVRVVILFRKQFTHYNPGTHLLTTGGRTLNYQLQVKVIPPLQLASEPYYPGRYDYHPTRITPVSLESMDAQSRLPTPTSIKGSVLRGDYLMYMQMAQMV